MNLNDLPLLVKVLLPGNKIDNSISKFFNLGSMFSISTDMSIGSLKR